MTIPIIKQRYFDPSQIIEPTVSSSSSFPVEYNSKRGSDLEKRIAETAASSLRSQWQEEVDSYGYNDFEITWDPNEETRIDFEIIDHSYIINPAESAAPPASSSNEESSIQTDGSQKQINDEPSPLKEHKTPEKRRLVNRKSSKKWRENHPEYDLERKRKWREDNPEAVCEYHRKWRRENPESNRKSCKKWRENHPEDAKNYNRLWNAEHKADKRGRDREAHRKWYHNLTEEQKAIFNAKKCENQRKRRLAKKLAQQGSSEA